ncbi:protein D3-like isoform X2 [Wyeomyia smithii]|uniref:protein D3-like isoform X2 n=1 Tax=Wyeomyia smithii TaxID=174621 RepID=UPI002467BA6A|nr:protein D3-like isoform X2 [Wyeomyia smithii]
MQADINQMFIEHDIVPVLIDRAPLVFAKVAYLSKRLVDAGKELTPSEVRNEPKVEWCADPTTFYTLVMIDADSPSRTEPINREFAHWLIGNIPGKHVEQGEILFEYMPIFPRSGTGFHRNRTPRVLFSTREFAQRYSLGHPIAGNFFMAQFDDYVPVILRQFPVSNDF